MKFLSEKGFGLPSLMASAATASVLMLAVASASGFFAKSMRSVQLKGELEDLRTMVRTNLDCLATITDQETACENGDYVEGRRHDNTAFFAGSPGGTQFGNTQYGVRARCIGSGGHYVLAVEYDSANKDPFTQQEGWRKLFGGVPFDCGDIGADALPGVHFRNPNFLDVLEETAGGDITVTVTVYLTSPTDVDVIVPVTVSGTATPGTDYDNNFREVMPPNNPVDLAAGIIIPAGNTQYSFEFDIHSESGWNEVDEDIIFEIGDPTNAIRVVYEDYTVTIKNLLCNPALNPAGNIDLSAFDPSFELYDGNNSANIFENGYFLRINPSPTAHDGGQSVWFDDVHQQEIRFPSHMHPTHLPLNPCLDYTFSAWFQAVDLGGGSTVNDLTIEITAHFYNSGAGGYFKSSIALTTNVSAFNNWESIDYDFFVPSGADSAYIEIEARAASATNMDLFIDDLSLVSSHP